MEILIFLFVFSNFNLVFTNETVAIDKKNTPVQNTYKVHPEPEDIDQIAQSSDSVTQRYGVGTGHTQEHHQSPPEVLTGAENGHVVHLQEAPRQLTLSTVPVHQYSSQQVYAPQAQKLYLQYPTPQVQIENAEASPLLEVKETQAQKPLGFTSVVEHVSEKDKEEIQSALREGSISDIKRLVPKSEMTFNIYPKEKPGTVENQKTEVQSNILLNSSPHTFETGNSVLHHRIKTEVPETLVTIQTAHQEYQLPTTEFSVPQTTILKTPEIENSLDVHLQEQQQQQQPEHYFQTVYYSQPRPQESIGETKGASWATPPYLKLSYEASPTPPSTIYQNIQPHSTTPFTDISNLHYQGYGKAERFQKGVQLVKADDTLHYKVDPLYQAENSQRVEYIHQQPPSIGQNSGQQTKKTVQSQVSGHSLNTESVKAAQFGNLGSNTLATSQSVRTNYLPAYSHSSVQHGYKNAVETKNSQTFDHQKALEGSTSFDIKNAIDNAGNFIHQPNYKAPTTEIVPFQNIQKPQVAYVIPKIPTSSFVIDNNIQETQGLESHQVKDFGHGGLSAHVSYQFAPEVSGKLFHQPQAIVWTSDHLKTAKNLHRPMLSGHIPKQEIYLKSPSIELPTSSVSHIYLPPKNFGFHYDTPFKTYPQEFVLQSKTKPRLQSSGHLKMSKPVLVDWSLFKSGMSNYNINNLSLKPEVTYHLPEHGKKIVPILIRKRKNRSNNNDIGGVVYGKATANGRPMKPSQRQEKSIHMNLFPEDISNIKKTENDGERKDEFSVSASYKVNRSLRTS